MCDNNTVDYVTLEEYDELNKKLFPIKPLGHYNIINSKLLLKFKNELVPLSLAATLLASLSGCASDTELTTKGLSKIGIETTMENEEYGLYKITEKDLGENTIYNNFDFSSIGDYPYSVLCTPGEFDKYVGKSNVTFNDLREAVKSNKNIPDDVAGIIIEGIDNLEAADFKINYSTLEYNLQKLNVKCVGVEDMLNANATGEFDRYTCTMLINSQTKDTPVYKHTIIHEILGHGSTIAYDSEKKVLCDVLSSYIKIDEKGNIADIYLYYGKFASEGIADTISSIAENKKFDYNISGYSTQIYDLTTLCSSVGISIEDFANYGIDYLTDKMIEKGIENPYQLILSLDNTVILYQSNVCLQSDSTPMLISY